jgi:hypothetical protein
VAAEIVSFAAGALAGFLADVVVVAAGVLELDELLPQPAAATASTGSIKIADIFFTKSSFGWRRHGRARIAATSPRLQIARQ